MEFLTTNKSYFGLDNRMREQVISRLSRQGTAGKTTRGNGKKVKNLFQESPEYPLTEQAAPFDDQTTYKTLFQDYCGDCGESDGEGCDCPPDCECHAEENEKNGGDGDKLPALNY